jgi:hypothetical protein
VLIAFVVTCLLVRHILPFPQVYRVGAKVSYFRAHGDEFDTVFIGSSRINHQVIPAQFDALTRAAGVPTKSFNAGIAGMRPPEDTYFFEQLVANRPKHLRWVFIEVNDIHPRMDWNVRGTMRAQYWHDPARLSLMLRRLSSRGNAKRLTMAARWRNLGENFEEAVDHVGFFVREMTNFGKGDFLSDRLITAPDSDKTLAQFLGPGLTGFIETGRGETLVPSYTDQFHRERADRLEKPAERDAGDLVSQENLERMIAITEQLGATPVLLIPPVTIKRVFYPTPARAKRTLVLDFDDPVKYPELYDDAHRLDPDHLNTAGAREFTRLIAEHWLARKATTGAGER